MTTIRKNETSKRTTDFFEMKGLRNIILRNIEKKNLHNKFR